ncbi:MAG: hypothetical protein FRX48_01200 [Lasallia pustulata]|uniref:Uncharacterized protein n=1 Tax=Lasallia pustulata TaxID=136370 RepID=A0A5M8PXK8_9LECA|nr:MAG: hypothetical protein FRX48_01200 [Lasallia pustulata]
MAFGIAPVAETIGKAEGLMLSTFFIILGNLVALLVDPNSVRGNTAQVHLIATLYSRVALGSLMRDERDRENLRSGSGRLVGEAGEIGGNRNLGELEVLKTNEEFRVEYILEESNLGLIVKLPL